jgi:SAM-dependent methyltransferase
MQRTKCVLCESTNCIPLLQVKDNRLHTTEEKFCLVRCLTCGIIYLNPRPNKEDIARFYPEAFYAKPTVMSKVVSEFLNRLKFRKVDQFKKTGRILDVGCGAGGLLHVFEQRGWKVFGVDTSEKACKLAEKTLGKHVCNYELKDCNFPDNFFDVIFLNHVIEHMPSPKEELAEMSRILKNDGIVIVFTPNIASYQFEVSGDKWLHLDIPRHVIFYSPQTISRLFANNGFKVVKINFPIFDFPFDLYFSLKIKIETKNILPDFILSPPLHFISLVVKLLPAWRGSMAVTAVKKSN